MNHFQGIALKNYDTENELTTEIGGKTYCVLIFDVGVVNKRKLICLIWWRFLFSAGNEGSVAMGEGEEMFVLEQDQGDGWTRVRKHDNSEGFVPTSYIQCHFYDQDEV